MVRMKLLGVALLATVVAPGVARAAPLTAFASRDVPLHGAPAHTAQFDLVGLHWLGSGSVSFRTHAAAGGWSAWHPAAPEPEDRPDGPPGKWKIGNPWWAGPSDGLQVRTRGQVARVRSYLVSSSA